MGAKFVLVDHDTPLLLPPDIRDWLPRDHMVHFVMDAVSALDMSMARVNERGTGSCQYPPGMMFGLLIYCYSTGTFSSRRIEVLSYENVAVRLLCADTHPDHDTICKFRSENDALFRPAFHQVLELAASTGVLNVGDLAVSFDGTKLLANASKHSAMSYGHVVEQMVLAGEQIDELVAKAEDAEGTPLRDGLSIPEEIARREDRIAKLRLAKEVIEGRAKARFEEEVAAHREKVAARQAKEEATGRKVPGKKPEPPREGPRDEDRYNFTDPESRIMKDGGGFQQCFNAQAAVDTASMLVVGGYVTDEPNDKRQLGPALASVSPAAGKVGKALADSGYFSEAAVKGAEAGGEGPEVYAATGRQRHGRTVAQLGDRPGPPPPPEGAGVAEVMAHRLATRAGKELYGLRKQTVEPVFGIIKEAMGFRRFLMRGLEKVSLEWTLVRTGYNFKRMFGMRMRNAAA